MRFKTSDEALAHASANGDAAAFSLLVERHYDRIYRLAFRLTGQVAEAEDLTQEVCLALPVKLVAFRAEAKFSTWLFRVVVNASHDRRRRAMAHARAATSWGEVELARLAETEEAADATHWLRSAMSSLPDELRDTLALILDEEMTHRETADVLGISEGTVSWRMSEIRRRLRDIKALEI